VLLAVTNLRASDSHRLAQSGTYEPALHAFAECLLYQSLVDPKAHLALLMHRRHGLWGSGSISLDISAAHPIIIR
jgi:hypothetical protein